MAERRRRLPRLAIAIALLAVALAVAFAVPQARSAILRFFHIGAVTIERVGTLPPARERALAVGLGAPISRREAERLLGPVRLPPVRGRVRLYSLDDVVSTILTTPDPVASVRGDVDRVRSSSYLQSIEVGGFIYDVETGRLSRLC